MQVCYYNPTDELIQCANMQEQQVVQLLIMFVTYCLDTLRQQSPTIPGKLSGLQYSFRSRFIAESVFDNILFVSLKVYYLQEHSSRFLA
jgi:hypothetical protein